MLLPGQGLTPAQSQQNMITLAALVGGSAVVGNLLLGRAGLLIGPLALGAYSWYVGTRWTGQVFGETH